MKDYSKNLRHLTIMAAIVAMAVILTFIRIPIVLFLEFEAKDMLLSIAGFMFNPISGILCSVVTALLEFLVNPASNDTGIYGLIMNIISSCLFVGISSLIYHRKHSLSSAIVALLCGTIVMTAGMLLWDYFIIPLYMAGATRETVAPMLLTTFLPFNLFKGLLNAVITMMLYKPLITALRSAKLLPPAEKPTKVQSVLPVTIISIFVLTTLILMLLAWKGII